MSKNPSSDSTNMFYEHNARVFAESTVNIDMMSLYRPFISNLVPNAKILDAGCGPGRDVKNFQEMGYDVVAFDASSNLVAEAKKLTQLPIINCRFQDIGWKNEFDGIWACASLLHVPESEIDEVISRLSSALKAGGIFYMSFKYGNEELFRNERLFNDYDEEKLANLLTRHDELLLKECWVTTDLRPGRESEKWLNVLLLKKK